MYEQQLKLYDALVEKCPRFPRKGKTMPYTSSNGYMFSLLNKSAEIGIRFSEKRKNELIEAHNTSIYKSHGATMRGYILVSTEMLNNTDLVVTLLNESYDYVMSLDPK